MAASAAFTCLPTRTPPSGSGDSDFNGYGDGIGGDGDAGEAACGVRDWVTGEWRTDLCWVVERDHATTTCR